MPAWVQQAIEAPEFGFWALPAALVLGLLTAVGSCCNVAMLAAVAGFAGSREGLRRRDVALTCVCFLAGTVVALAAVGAAIGYLGQAAGQGIGRVGALFAGFVTIFFGLWALKLVPVRLPKVGLPKGWRPRGLGGSALFGLAAGASSATCAVACSGPLVPIVLGLAVMRGQGLWGLLIMTAFAIGYSAPLTAMMLGVGLGRLSGLTARAAGPIRVVAGLLLVGAGFWMLASA